MEIDGLTAMRKILDRAEMDIAESEARIRDASVIREQLVAILANPAGNYLSTIPIPATSVDHGWDGSVGTQSGKDYFRDMTELLPALRASKGYKQKLYLIAGASGGTVNLSDVALFLVNEGYSKAKDVEDLVRNLTTTIRKDSRFVQDPKGEKVYCLRPFQWAEVPYGLSADPEEYESTAEPGDVSGEKHMLSPPSENGFQPMAVEGS